VKFVHAVKILLLNVNGNMQGFSLPDEVSLTKQAVMGCSGNMALAKNGNKLKTTYFVIFIWCSE
jgi:hypothetical protein